MKERPILMTPENAQKCFQGIKTQTRRIVKDQTIDPNGIYAHRPGDLLLCPYGVVGDRLWIREAWAAYSGGVTIEGEEYDLIEGPIDINEISPPVVVYRGAGDSFPERWRPAMHMYRWACRTVVEITEIRVQRLKDEMTEEDAIAEGCTGGYVEGACSVTPRGEFALLWMSINGADSWDANPWVWAITFKKVEL